jgi:archaellum component FlaF (FlaF/FlaG flagellin family)
MRPITVSKTGTGSSSTAVMDHHMNPFNVGMAVKVSGTVNYTVQHTFDNIVAGETPTYFNHPVLQSLTANADGNYAFPVTGIRVTVNSGSGSASLVIIQAGD